MKNTHLFFLSILILIGIGCRKEDKGNMMEEDRFTEQQLLGTWDGSFNQVGYGDFTGSVTITELKVDEVTATGHYNSPPCPFQWIYTGTSADGKSYLFKESLTVENTECAPGRVQLRFKDQDHLYYNWTGDDVTGNNVASGILTRK
jgi:hypothetical protein